MMAFVRRLIRAALPCQRLTMTQQRRPAELIAGPFLWDQYSGTPSRAQSMSQLLVLHHFPCQEGERPSIDQPVIRQAVWSSRKNSLQKCLLASPEMECSFCRLVGGMSGERDGSDPLCWHHPLSPALSDSAHLIRRLPRQRRERDECGLL